MSEYRYDARRNEWYLVESLCVVHDEDMPGELTP